MSNFTDYIDRYTSGRSVCILGFGREGKSTYRILKKYCSERKQVNDSTSSYGRGMKKDSVAEETTVGGATMFVLNVEEYDKI